MQTVKLTDFLEEYQSEIAASVIRDGSITGLLT